MRRRYVLAIVLACISGLFASSAVTTWMQMFEEQTRDRYRSQVTPVDMTKIVLARESLAFGAKISPSQLKEVEWPTSSIPQGSFRSIGEVLFRQNDRVVLEAMHPDEPILATKISGPNQRASLSTMLAPGMMAVSISVNDVAGVAGFVLPGDRVDLLLTYKSRNFEDSSIADQEAFNDVLLENVRVLAIDQAADPKLTKPSVSRTVTVEVQLKDAQKVALAGSIGTISLALRQITSSDKGSGAKRLALADMVGDIGDKGKTATFVPTNAVAGPPAPKAEEKSTKAHIVVVRAAETKDYSVPRRD